MIWLDLLLQRRIARSHQESRFRHRITYTQIYFVEGNIEDALPRGTRITIPFEGIA